VSGYPPPEIRFWRHIQKTDGCWLWKSRSRISSGYGWFGVAAGNMWVASRYSWFLHYGPIPEGLFVLHHCDVRLCVRPDHLFLGTQLDNIRDAIAKGRRSHVGARGERNGRSRLTEIQVQEIRRRYAAGERTMALAREFGVHRDTVRRILSGIRWNHAA
jgi:hypothetical protein